MDNIDLDKNIASLIGKINIFSDEQKILEYDIQPTENECLYLIEQNHYLLINKLKVKEFYFFYRQKVLNFDLKRFDCASSFEHLDTITKTVLLVNPNLSTAWSKRKYMLTCRNVEYSKSNEIQFLNLILLKNFKCEQAYMHRRWVLKRVFSDSSFEIDFVNDELQFLVDRLSKKIKSNYYLWTYFNWFILFVFGKCESLFIEYFYNYLKTKFTDVLYMNPSDFCFFNSRLNLIRTIYSNYDCVLIADELKIIDELLIRFSAYMTVWNYAKYFLIFLKQTCSEKIPSSSNIVNVHDFFRRINQHFNTTIKTVHFKTNKTFEESANYEQFVSNREFITIIIRRQIEVSEFIFKICKQEQMHNEMSKIENLSISFNDYLKKFLLN